METCLGLQDVGHCAMGHLRINAEAGNQIAEPVMLFVGEQIPTDAHGIDKVIFEGSLQQAHGCVIDEVNVEIDIVGVWQVTRKGN